MGTWIGRVHRDIHCCICRSLNLQTRQRSQSIRLFFYCTLQCSRVDSLHYKYLLTYWACTRRTSHRPSSCGSLRDRLWLRGRSHNLCMSHRKCHTHLHEYLARSHHGDNMEVYCVHMTSGICHLLDDIHCPCSHCRMAWHNRVPNFLLRIVAHNELSRSGILRCIFLNIPRYDDSLHWLHTQEDRECRSAFLGIH